VKGIASLDQHAVRLHRLAHRLGARGRPRMAAGVAAINKICTGVEIAPSAQIGPGLRLVHGSGIVIGMASVLGPGCTVYQDVTIGTRYDVPGDAPDDPDAAEPRLGTGVLVFSGAKILGPVSIGDGAVIGANAVVLQDVPAGKLAVGIPAQVCEPRSAAAPAERARSHPSV
jgi:serine O-acetyltransferase